MDLVALDGGLHFREGKAWLCLDGDWVRVPAFDRSA